MNNNKDLRATVLDGPITQYNTCTRLTLTLSHMISFLRSPTLYAKQFKNNYKNLSYICVILNQAQKMIQTPLAKFDIILLMICLLECYFFIYLFINTLLPFHQRTISALPKTFHRVDIVLGLA